VSGGRPAAVSASGHRPDGQEWCPPRRWRRRAGRHAPDRVDRPGRRRHPPPPGRRPVRRRPPPDPARREGRVV